MESFEHQFFCNNEMSKKKTQKDEEKLLLYP